MPKSPRMKPRPANEAALFPRPLQLTLIVVLFVGALGVRLHHITEPLLGFRTVRQYRSALIARSYYYKMLDAVPTWKVHNAQLTADKEGSLQPPLIEGMTAVAYRLCGGEFLWVPRGLSCLFWLVGGAFVYLLAARFTGDDAALLATAVYLYIPFGIASSRAFQPDPMMIMLCIAALFGSPPI